MRKLLYSICFLLIGTSSFAGSINFVAKCSHKTVEVGQKFKITFSVNSSGGNFTPPDFGKLRYYNGGQSSSSQNINGSVAVINSISYIIIADAPGNYTIEPAGLEVNGETYKSNSIKIEVVASNQNSANSQRKKQNARKKTAKEVEDYIFIQPVIGKRNLYVGESVSVTFKLYYQLPVRNLSQPDKMPDYNGFWSKDITLGGRQELPIERINGEEYNVIILNQVLLSPQKAGELEIGSLEMNSIVQIRTRQPRNNMERVMGVGLENKEVRLISKPIKITVKPLPSTGKPADFSGAVGQFTMNFKPNKTNIKSNQSIDFEIKITGSGNLPLIGAPKLSFPPDFEAYDPETKNSFSTNMGGSQGSKSFSYLVIPRHSGTFDIEPFAFNFFDPIAKKYKTISHNPIQIQVEKGEEEENVSYTPRDKQDIELLGTDIRYLHINNIALASGEGLFYGSATFYLLILFGIFLIAALFFLSKKFKERNTDTIGIKKSKANKLAKKRMAKAKKHLDAKESTLFYEEISAALFGYYADKFNISLAELSQDRIVDLVNDDTIATELKIVLDEAEMARFAPSSSISETDLYEKAVNIISKTEGLAL